MSNRPLSALVLAAGEGTRMHSQRPKPLHRLCGRPMILHVLDALAELPVQKVVVVVGHRGEWVTKTLVDHAPSSLSIEFVEQPEQLGTADALAVGLTALPEALADADGDVVVLPGDTPLVRAPTLAALVRHHRSADAAATLLTALLSDPTGYDRVVRGKDATVVRVVEDSEVTDDERDVDEVATTIHCFRHSMLAPALRRLRPVVTNGEHSLTGLYAVLHDAGYRVESLVAADPMEAAGVNDRAQLAVAEAELRERINERWMRRGVTMWDPENTSVDAEVYLEPEIVLLPGVVLQGTCNVSAGAEIGPDCRLVDTEVGEGALITTSSAFGAVVGAHARVGPYAYLGPGAVVEQAAVVPPFTRFDARAEDPGEPGDTFG
jgi:bifunctional UDP-N-acetylglucosamine pyrophosphorylase / glucosamine-1-phosphate N-acetyltransferase